MNNEQKRLETILLECIEEEAKKQLRNALILFRSWHMN